MILVFDIGNTNIHVGYFRNGNLFLTKKWPTKMGLDRYLLKKLLYKKTIYGIGIASVVPSLSQKLSRLLTNDCSIKSFTVNSRIKMPVKIAYNNLGADRIANINGAYIYYKDNLIIFSFGTAITGDVVLKNGIHKGGLIIPGPEIQLWSLSQRTALIRNVNLINSAPLLGKSTAACVQSGIINGIKFSIERFIKEIRKIYKKDFHIVATGGWAEKICQLIPEINNFEPHLTLSGIYHLYNQNVKD